MKIYHAWAQKIYTEFGIRHPAAHLHVLTPHGDLSLYFNVPLSLTPQKLNTFIEKESAIQTLTIKNNILNVDFTHTWWWQHLEPSQSISTKNTVIHTPLTTITQKGRYIIQLIQQINHHSQRLFPHNSISDEKPSPSQDPLTTASETAMIKLCVVYGKTAATKQKILYQQLVETFFSWWRETCEPGNILRFIRPQDIDRTRQRLWLLNCLAKALHDKG